ncbi:hypothetical protein [Mycetocola manganoxydans]|uniref:hypothetical protein n=1 Tax=Mycetocola manganoxydans TaxID=699879 RepID=UPI001601A41F|nr:hypothetical protein [Mycetocola manganoxydans]GHD41712.1 hypothetical protein GCM10008097_06780 [Mycetocola manganoxydans]
MNIPITQGLSTFEGLASVLVMSIVGFAIVMAVSGSVKSVNIRSACMLALVVTGATLVVLIASGNKLVADEIVWHSLAEEASRFLTGQSNARVDYVEGKEGYLWIIGALYAISGPVPMMAIVLNTLLNALTVVTVARTTEIITKTYPLLPEEVCRRAVRLAALFAALLPSLFIWAPRVLREAPSTFLISVAVLGTLQVVRTRQTRYAVLALGAVAGLAWIRGPVGMALGVALAIGAVLVWSHKSEYRLAIRFFLLIPLLALIAVAWELANTQFGLSAEEVALRNRELASVASSGFAGTAEATGSLGYGTILMVNVPRVFAGPFPWEITAVSPVMLLALMEGIIWVAALILAMRAIYVRRRFVDSSSRAEGGPLVAILTIATLALLATLAVSVANYGLLARLRPMALVIILPLAAIAIASWPAVRALRLSQAGSRKLATRPATGLRGFGS